MSENSVLSVGDVTLRVEEGEGEKTRVRVLVWETQPIAINHPITRGLSRLAEPSPPSLPPTLPATQTDRQTQTHTAKQTSALMLPPILTPFPPY